MNSLNIIVMHTYTKEDIFKTVFKWLYVTSYKYQYQLITDSPTAIDKVSVTNTGSAIPNSTSSCSLVYFANDFVMTELLKLMLGLQLRQPTKNTSVCNVQKI